MDQAPKRPRHCTNSPGADPQETPAPIDTPEPTNPTAPAPTPDDQATAESIAAITETFTRPDLNGCAIVDGWGTWLGVSNRALTARDGLGPTRRERTWQRATHQLRRVIVTGQTGSITLDALRWLNQLDIPLAVLDSDGHPTFASTPKRAGDDARLRRTRTQAAGTELGSQIARLLLGAKLAGQARNARHQLDRPDTADDIDLLREALSEATTTDETRELEATAANLYWSAWAGTTATTAPRFPKRTARQVPDHWRRFDTRRSVLASANGNRNASHPTNAILNYLFALLEVESTLACQTVGLDPGLGVVHLDTPRRASMALDLAETVRPDIESWVLDLLRGHTFSRRDFHERPDGSVRILPPFTHQLIETLPQWREKVAPWAEKVAHLLGEAIAGRFTPTTPLTRQRHRRAQAEVRTRKALAVRAGPTVPQRPAKHGRQVAPWSCPDCGAPVPNARHVRCDTCIAADTRQTPALRRKRAAAISARRQTEAGWALHRPAGPTDTTWWLEELRPALSRFKVSEIMAAAGVAKSLRHSGGPASMFPTRCTGRPWPLSPA